MVHSTAGEHVEQALALFLNHPLLYCTCMYSRPPLTLSPLTVLHCSYSNNGYHGEKDCCELRALPEHHPHTKDHLESVARQHGYVDCDSILHCLCV